MGMHENAHAEESATEHWCFAWLGERLASPGEDRGTLLKEAQWGTGDTITVSFLEGSADIQAKIRDVAMQWVAPGLANLRFQFRAAPPSDIRISFSHPGNWSMLGKTCRQRTDQSMPTMNYSSLRGNPTQEQIRRYVLHEFGHALGMLHEHQHPENGIQWDREAVIEDLSGPPNNWTEAQIEFNLFQPFSHQETNFTSGMDPASIMMYPIPSHWTTNDFTTGLNSELSAQDKNFIHKMYT